MHPTGTYFSACLISIVSETRRFYEHLYGIFYLLFQGKVQKTLGTIVYFQKHSYLLKTPDRKIFELSQFSRTFLNARLFSNWSADFVTDCELFFLNFQTTPPSLSLQIYHSLLSLIVFSLSCSLLPILPNFRSSGSNKCYCWRPSFSIYFQLECMPSVGFISYGSRGYMKSVYIQGIYRIGIPLNQPKIKPKNPYLLQNQHKFKL